MKTSIRYTGFHFISIRFRLFSPIVLELLYIRIFQNNRINTSSIEYKTKLEIDKDYSELRSKMIYDGGSSK